MRKMSKSEFVMRMLDDAKLRQNKLATEIFGYFKDRQRRRDKWKKRQQTR